MAKDDFEDFLSKITFAESRGKRTDSSGKLLEGPMTKYGTAKGELQVLDSTNKRPGYGVVAAKDETPDERARVGRDYLKAMLDKFKDKRTAAIAYNWGPGNTQKWLDAGADEAGLPKETQNYVKKVMGTEVAKAPAPDMAPAPRQAAGAPAVPANRPTVSRETVGPGAQAEDRLSALGPSYQAAMALSFLGDTTNPAPQEDDEDELRISGDESRSAAREDDDVTQFLTGPSARSALADFDFKIQSPFAERVAAAFPVNRAKGSPEEGETSITDQLIGAGETALTLGSGALSSVVGMPYGLYKGLTSGKYLEGKAPAIAEKEAQAFIERNTYVPRSKTGRENLDELNRLMEQSKLPPILPETAMLRSIPRAAVASQVERTGMAAEKALDKPVTDVLQKGGKSAEMLKGLSAPPSYAVRAKGTPMVMSPVREPSADNMTDKFLASLDDDKTKKDAFFTKNPDINSWNYEKIRNTPEFKDFSTAFLAPRDEVTKLLDSVITQKLASKRIGGPPVSVDPALNNWFSKTFARYLRSDFASPSDQLVKAADDGKLLHLAPKELRPDNVNEALLGIYLTEKKSDLKNTREAEGFPKYGMAQTEYGQRIEDLTDLSAYPESIGDLSPSKVPIGMRGLVETNPEARAMDLAPSLVGNLKLNELRNKMSEIRQSGGQYSAYGQPVVKVPPEFLLPDDTLAKLNVAAASNRVARFTDWQDEARQGMATTSLRTDPRFRRDLSSDGKYMGVFIPDLAKSENQELKKLVTDVGCDGGWCTRRERFAMEYGGGDASLSLVITNDGKKARPVAQVGVKSKGVPGSSNESHSIIDIAGKNNSRDFADNPALPAIQEHVKNLDYIYGGFKDIAYLKELGMVRIPEDPIKLLDSISYTTSNNELLGKLYILGGAGTKGMSIGLGKLADEAIRLNEKSFLLVGNNDTLNELLQQALKNVTTPQPRAKGGFIERESNDNRKYL